MNDWMDESGLAGNRGDASRDVSSVHVRGVTAQMYSH